MRGYFAFWAALLISLGGGAQSLFAQSESNIATVELGPNRADEPVSKEFSLQRAVDFLDSVALNWQEQRNCMTCHTNYAYLYARPAVSSDSYAHTTVRKYADQLVTQRWPEKGPRWDAEVVATAAALSFNDAHTTGVLANTTRQALDRMWSIQREDGGFSWIKCGWPPMESDDHYGATLAAIAVGVAPKNYRETSEGKAGLQKIYQYFEAHPPATLHHRAMMLWADSYLGDLLNEQEEAAYVDQLLKLQKPDGGWALAELGDWDRADGSPQDLETSDGYATGFMIYVLRRADIPIENRAIQKGLAWLKASQRESGRWFTRSLNRDNKHFISHAGTAMAIMALQACNSKTR